MLSEIDPGDLARALHQAALVGGTMIDQVPDIPEGEPCAQEWRAFKREVYRLIKEGHTGKFAVFKRDRLVGIWNTFKDAMLAEFDQKGDEPFLVQEIELFVRPQYYWGGRRRWVA